MQNKKVQKWAAISKKGRNLAILLLDSVAPILNKDYFAKYHGTDFYPKNWRQFNQARWIGIRDYKNYIIFFKTLLKKDPQKVNFLIERTKKHIKRLRAFKLKHTNFSNLDNEYLSKYLYQFLGPFSKIMMFVYDFMILNEILTPQLYKIIAKRISDPFKREEYAQILSRPARMSDSLKSEVWLRRICRKYQKGQKIDKEIKKYLEEFAYLGIYAFYGGMLTQKDVLARVRLATTAKNDHRSGVFFPAKIQRDLKINREERKIIEVMREYASLGTEIQEAANYAICQGWNLWKEIARRFKIPLDHFFQMRIEEIIKGLKEGGISCELKRGLRRRSKDSVYLFEDGKISVLTGRELTNYYNQNLPKEKPKKVKFLKGQKVCPGRVQGRVRVIIDLNEIKDFKKDEILVAAFTTPAFGVALSKAKAVITDTGGLLSHAAIICRELQKPCLIGTKIATKVLKNGDLVEVDAEKGIVRKI